MIDKPLLEASNWHVAHNWSEGLDLTYAGINLSDLITYSLLMILGRIQLAPVVEPIKESPDAG